MMTLHKVINLTLSIKGKKISGHLQLTQKGPSLLVLFVTQPLTDSFAYSLTHLVTPAKNATLSAKILKLKT